MGGCKGGVLGSDNKKKLTRPPPKFQAYQSTVKMAYKKCSVCSECSSCGNYNEDKEWVCEECEQEQHETTCDFCSKKMTDDELTGERCSGCEKWCCNTCDESLGYLEEDVKEKCALCSNCIESS